MDRSDLTCHVAVNLCGTQGTTPIRINGVEARGAAKQLVGLTGRLVNGWTKQSGDRNQLFLRELANAESPDCSLSVFIYSLFVAYVSFLNIHTY